MIQTRLISSLAIAVSLGWAMPASAQSATDIARMTAQMEAMQAQLDAMKSKVDTLEGQLTQAQAEAQSATATAQTATASAAKATEVATKTAEAAPKIAWKGAPEFTGKDGWSFKPRGRIHIDAGTISTPGEFTSTTLGGKARVRRVRLGFEGTVPGGLGYKAEVDFANASVGFGDVWITYIPTGAPMQVRIGNFETLNSMEQISGSNFVSFIERSTFNDAFINARRLGAALAWHSKDNDWRAEVGLFAAHSIDSSLDNNGLIGAARLVYAPEVAGGQLHFGLNYQYRDFADNIGGVASTGIGMPSTNQLARYRARPGSQLTDVRFVDTGSFAAHGDQLLGLEASAIFKGLYVSGEAQWLRSDAYAAGDRASGLDSFTGGNLAVVSAGNPGFFGAYGEIGYFLTGETRGYKRGDGTWARTKVLNPVTKGGSGAFQLAARVDHVDLDDDALKAGPINNFTTGIASPAAVSGRLARGGSQTGYLLALNWYPMDYVRFMVNYGHFAVKGGPVAQAVRPLSSVPIDQRKYGVDVLQTRLQIDF